MHVHSTRGRETEHYIRKASPVEAVAPDQFIRALTGTHECRRPRMDTSSAARCFRHSSLREELHEEQVSRFVESSGGLHRERCARV